MNRKKHILIFSFFLVYFSIICLPQASGETKLNKMRMRQITTGSDVRGYKNQALQEMDFGLDLLGDIFKKTSEEPSKTIGRWDELSNKYFGLWDNLVGMMMLKGREKKMESELKPWLDDNNKFLDEIKKGGRTAVVWLQKCNFELYTLQEDIDYFPGKKSTWLTDIKKIDKDLEEMKDLIYSSDGATVDAITGKLDKLQQSRNMVKGISSTLIDLGKRSIQNHGKKFVLDPKVKKIMSRWLTIGEEYSNNIMQRWKIIPQKWEKNLKKNLKKLKSLRDKYDKLYEPVFSNKLFSGIKNFEGLKYEEMISVIDKMDLQLLTFRAKVVNKNVKLEELRKNIEEDKKITAKERIRITEILSLTDATKERELNLRIAQINNETRRRDISQGKKVENIDVKLKAAKKDLNDFYKNSEKLNRELTEIYKKREKRRKKLGR